MADNNPKQEQQIEAILNNPAFKNLNSDQRRTMTRELQKVTVSASFSEQYSGPLPHPALLGQFNQVIPNGAERIMAMVEKQNNHRMGLENTVITNQQKQSTLGQYFALAITIFGLLLSAWAINTGHDTAGGTLGAATIGSVAVAFITGRNKQQANLKAKSTE